ncbi:MAG: lipopolysaccharide heptosyltransferase I [Pseudohongiella sp.]|uniref:lipopolysaccharide heptosyltransferase I n=1 Tax=Pseudohongiella sp. TaxID=1979412 RepID=UPI0034A0731F
MHILIVKTSSLGDVIHTLPAVSDAARAIPGIRIDWVVEEAFAEIPAWHPAVDRVIPVAIRRWRKNWWHNLFGGEVQHFRQLLKQSRYDLIIDAQGLLKSALVSRQARGPVSGLDKDSIKEPVASRFYHQRHAVPKAEHAVQRVRQLFARSLGYAFDASALDYGIVLPSTRLNAETADERPNLMFLHGTTWDSKHWPEVYWRELARMASDMGYQVKLPWGSADEQERALRLAQGLAGVQVLPRMSLSALARELSASAGVVAVDTGLGHLAAALNCPTVSIYGATNPFLSGTFGYHQLQLKSDLPCSPCMRRQCHYQGQPLTDTTDSGESFVVTPACYRSAPPAAVLAHLQRMMEQATTPEPGVTQ